MDELDLQEIPRAVFYVEDVVQDATVTSDGGRRLLSKRIFFVSLNEKGEIKRENDILALVQVSKDFVVVSYLCSPFQKEPDPTFSSANIDIKTLFKTTRPGEVWKKKMPLPTSSNG